MTRNRDLVLIRKLCGMGLPAQTLAPSLLPALRRIIPAHSAAVFWVDEHFEMAGLYAERLLPPEAMAHYYLRHYQQAVSGFPRAFAARAAASDAVSVHRYTKQEQESPYFRDVLCQLGAYQILYGVLRDATRPFGQISIYRDAQDPEFGRLDQNALRSLLRYLSIGLRPVAPSAESVAPAEQVEEWLGIVDLDGAPVSAPPDWSRLVRLLAMGAVTPHKAREEQRVVRDFLRRLCVRLLGPEGAASGLIDAQHASPWGRFRVRVYFLPDAVGGAENRIGVLVGRTEPRALALVRGTGASGLSSQQREVALLVAAGKSNQEIARMLSLSLNTVGYHVKKLFARLGVHDRNDVEQALLRLAQEGIGGPVRDDEAPRIKAKR
jgi:DNA-binding CsgD family transcriptional regulator